MADSNRRPLACQARAEEFAGANPRLEMSRRRTSATVLCRSNCGPDCGPPAGRDAEPTGPFVARIAGPAQSPGLSLRRAACEAGSPSVNSVVPKDGHLAGQHTPWASNSVAILSGRCTRNVHSATKSSNALSASYGRPPPCTANSISVSAERCESEDLIERVRPALGASAAGKYAVPAVGLPAALVLGNVSMALTQADAELLDLAATVRA
jgi:hypothetical protein